jgi:hypothetical protein
MSKSQQIRDALAGGAMTFAELHEKLGGDVKKLRDLVNFLTTKDEVSSMGRGATRSIALKGERKRRAAEAPHSMRGKRVKPAGKARRAQKTKERAARGGKTSYRVIAARLAQAAANANGSLARRHVVTTLAVLESVIDLDQTDRSVNASA